MLWGKLFIAGFALLVVAAWGWLIMDTYSPEGRAELAAHHAMVERCTSTGGEWIHTKNGKQLCVTLHQLKP